MLSVHITQLRLPLCPSFVKAQMSSNYSVLCFFLWNLFPHFHRTSFVDILQTTLSNKVPIVSSCGVTLYICRKKQEKQKRCIRKKKPDDIPSKNMYTRKDYSLLPHFYTGKSCLLVTAILNLDWSKFWNCKNKESYETEWAALLAPHVKRWFVQFYSYVLYQYFDRHDKDNLSYLNFIL